jgi:hypothetical protein
VYSIGKYSNLREELCFLSQPQGVLLTSSLDSFIKVWSIEEIPQPGKVLALEFEYSKDFDEKTKQLRTRFKVWRMKSWRP